VRARVPRLNSFVSLTEYSKEFDIPVAFPPEQLENVFGEYISRLGLRQLRLAETEKYAHVTFFFNGGREQVFEGEERILIPSPKVRTYDLKPEMSAPEVTDALVAAIKSGKYDAIVCNYANADMVGHTGMFAAAVAAVEALDGCLGRVVEALRQVGGEMLITADHGNAEQMEDVENDQPHTAHTQNPVPLLYVGRPARLQENGALCDIAPTLLTLMGLAVPSEMRGHTLLDMTDADDPTG
jgi:2,3-bisphosphoglycerate-independent phosphoglycerate mutase